MKLGHLVHKMGFDKTEVPMTVGLETTVNTWNSGPWYSGFTCVSGQNCAEQLWLYEVNSHLK